MEAIKLRFLTILPSEHLLHALHICRTSLHVEPE